MNYENHYNRLIERARNRTINKFTEKHHVIPRCLGGTDDLQNIVRLTPEEHYVAHQLLVRMYPEHPRLAHAAQLMCSRRSTNKLYGWIRRRAADTMRTNNPNADGRHRRKPITVTGETVQTFGSLNEAAAEMRLQTGKVMNLNSIIKYMKLDQPYKGLSWKYV